MAVQRCSDEEYETDDEAEVAEVVEGDAKAAADKTAQEEEDDLDDDDMPDISSGQFFCEQVRAVGLPVGPGVPTEARPLSQPGLTLCMS